MGLIVCFVVARSALGQDYGTYPDAIDLAVEENESGEPGRRNVNKSSLQSVLRWKCGCDFPNKVKAPLTASR